MTKIKDFIILSSICLTLYSCKGEQSSIEYNADALETAETCNATLEKIDTEVELGSPSRIEFISDSLMVIFDQNVNDYVANIMDTEGHYITGFGRKGRGEGEIVTPINMTINERRDSAFIYDFMLQRLIGFDLHKLISREQQSPSVLQIDINSIPNQKYRFSHVKCGPDGDMLGFGCETNRIVSLKNGKAQETYTEYPFTDPDPETNCSIWDYSGDLKSISPDMTRLVVGTYIGGLFEIFSLADGKITSRTVKGFYKPDYVYAEGAIPKCVTLNPETMIGGFRTIVAGNDDFVTVIDGPMSKRINEILTFDYDGNLKNKKIIKDGWIDKLGRNDKGDIYCFGWDNDFNEMNLYHVVTQSSGI